MVKKNILFLKMRGQRVRTFSKIEVVMDFWRQLIKVKPYPLSNIIKNRYILLYQNYA